ncbi:hypothetical protein Slin15195_G102370 [Septoria linicola]|uniref:Uncharacterized protein n=1 Tax=Septoria linicola TaxID=215465 RepID=A0A9Q9B0Z7_9PEZI|nr:hypothetical protein Slin14017_G065370 [Septoria linicola]USW56918.1 hypothetical protein Slin15195_G102370 [Septoria linicola]
MSGKTSDYNVDRYWIYEYMIFHESRAQPGTGEARLVTFLDQYGHIIPKHYHNAVELKPDWESRMEEAVKHIKNFVPNQAPLQKVGPVVDLEHGEYRQEVQLSSPLPIASIHFRERPFNNVWFDCRYNTPDPVDPRIGVLRTPAKAKRQQYRKVSWDPGRNVAWVTSKIYPACDCLANEERPKWLADWVDGKAATLVVPPDWERGVCDEVHPGIPDDFTE